MKSKISTILFWAFLFRVVLLVYQYNIGNLPSAGADSVRFERVAYQISTGQHDMTIVEAFTSKNAYIHCFLGSTIYSVFGRVPDIWAFVHLIMGLFVVYNIHKSVLISTESARVANRAGWIAAFFPNLAIFSVILLREIYVHFFISFAILFLIKYIKFKGAKNLFVFLAMAILGSVFHSATFGIVFGFIVYITLFNKNANALSKVLVLIISLIFIAIVNFTGVGLSKFGGSFDEALDMAMGEASLMDHAGSNYPEWMVIKGGISGIVLLPIRMIAFLFAPLVPFMVRSSRHAIGLLDAFFYLLIFYNIYKGWFYHKKSEFSKALLVMTLTFVMVFSFGASNFGTNIRHRTKVIPVLLAIPLISKKERRAIKELGHNETS